MSPATRDAPHTNDTSGARRIADAFALARAGGRAALIPYVVAGYPDAYTSFAAACTAIAQKPPGMSTSSTPSAGS